MPEFADEYEDADESNWDTTVGQDNFATFTSQTNTVIEGGRSLKAEHIGDKGVVARRSFSPQKPRDIVAYERIGSSTVDMFSTHGWESNGNRVIRVSVFDASKGDKLQVNGTKIQDGVQQNKWYKFELLNIDYANNEVGTVKVDGSVEASNVGFFNSASELDAEQVQIRSDAGDDAVAFFDAGGDAQFFPRRLGEEVTLAGGPSLGQTFVENGRFQTPSNNSTITEGLPFEPDVIQFRITSTNPNFNNVTTNATDDFGWGHGFANFKGSKEQLAVSHASGSNSTNGHISESTSNNAIFQLISDASGNSLNGRIEASVSKNGKGFDANFGASAEQQQVLYTAYKFTGGDVDIGFFNAPSSNGTKSITEPGFRPNFLRLFGTPSLNFMDSQNNEGGNGTDVGWGQGVAVENSSSGVKQGSLAVSQFSSNIDGHAYTSSDTDALSIAFMNGKQSLDGTLQGTASFTSNGFDMSFATNPPNGETPLIVYMAAKSTAEPDAGFETTPTSTGTISYSTDFQLGNVNVFSSNTIPAFNQERGVGRQTWGWNYGQADSASDTQQIGFYSNSNSVNGHAFAAGSTAYRSLYTGPNGGEVGRVEGDVSSLDSSSYSINYSTISQSSSNSNVEGDTEAFVWYGFGTQSVDTGLGAAANLIESTVTKLSISEVLNLSDSVAQAFNKVVLEGVTVFDADVFQASKPLLEGVAASDAESNVFSGGRNLFESPTMQDAVEILAEFSLAATLSLNDVQSDLSNLGTVVSDGVFNTGEFDEATFNNVSRSQSPQIADALAIAVERLQEISLNEAVSVFDADVFQASKPLVESLSLGDSESLSVDKAFSESVGTAASFRSVSLRRFLNETFDLSDLQRSLPQLALSESLGLLDSAASESSLFRSFSESVQPDDTESVRLSKGLAESLGLSDRVVSASSLFRALSESVAPVDERRVRVSRPVAESIGVSDRVVTVTDLARNLVESLDLVDRTSSVVNKPVPEQFAVSDAVERKAELQRSFTEFFVAADSDILEVEQPLIEKPTFNDVQASDTALQRVFNESFLLDDLEASELRRPLSEVAAVSDEARSLASLIFSESVSAGDVVDVLGDFKRTPSESPKLSANFNDDLAVIVKLVEAIPSDDSVELRKDQFRSVSEQPAVQDKERASVFRGLSESASLADEEAFLFSTALRESPNLSDTEAFLLESLVAEGVGVGDSVEATAELLRVLAEVVQSSDSERFSLSRPLTESPALDDNQEFRKDQFRDFAETVVASDNAALALSRIVFETFVADDVADVEAQLFRLFLASVGVRSDVSEFSAFRVFDEALGVSDAVQKNLSRLLTEAATPTDEAERAAVLRRNRTESLDVPDSVALQLGKSLAEGVSITDLFKSDAELSRRFLEQVPVQDLRELLLETSLSEDVPVKDDAASLAELLRGLDESVQLSDADVRFLAQRVFKESSGLSDDVRKSVLRSLQQAVFVSDAVFSEAELRRIRKEFIPVADSDVFEFQRPLEVLLSVDDSFAREADLSRDFDEQAVLDDAERFSLSRAFSEGVPAADQATSVADLFRDVAAVVGSSDETATFAERIFTESTAVEDVESAFTFIPVSESVAASDVQSTFFATAFSESASLADVVEPRSELFRDFSESASLDDVERFLAALLREESVPVRDTQRKTVFDVVSESFSSVDRAVSEAELFRAREQGVRVQDSESVFAAFGLSESAEVLDVASKSVFRSLSEVSVVDDNAVFRRFALKVAREADLSLLRAANVELFALRKAIADIEADG